MRKSQHPYPLPGQPSLDPPRRHSHRRTDSSYDPISPTQSIRPRKPKITNRDLDRGVVDAYKTTIRLSSTDRDTLARLAAHRFRDEEISIAAMIRILIQEAADREAPFLYPIPADAETQLDKPLPRNRNRNRKRPRI